jgi:ribonuclease HI
VYLRFRYPDWPKLNWGLILGCALGRFRNSKGKIIPSKNIFFAVVVSVSMKLIWNLRNNRVFERHCPPSKQDIHNCWLAAINAALRQDQLLTNTARFGDLATKKQVVLNTWSGTLFDEDSLPDDWTKTKGF